MSYPTLADAKEWIPVTGTSEDQIVTGILSFAVSYIEGRTKRQFVAASKTVTLSRSDAKSSGVLRVPEFLSISSVIADGESIDSELYSEVGLPAQDSRFMLTAKNMTNLDWNRYSEIVISGVFGFSAACPDDVRGLILDHVRNLYQSRNSPVMGGQINRDQLLAIAGGQLPPYGDAVIAYYRAS